MTDVPGKWSRRASLLGGLSAVGLLGYVGWRRATPSPQFRALRRPEGFRWLLRGEGGASSGAAAVLAGIDAPPERAEITDLCGALFQGVGARGAASAAVFTDYRCPYCKVLTKRLLQLAESQPDRMRLHVHEWPALGPVSERMARIALAARAQGAWRPMHDLLDATPFMPSDGWIVQAAEKLSLSAPRLLRDMQGPETARALAETAALAALFGFSGTPGVVIGRNAAEGVLTEQTLNFLVEDARGAGAAPGCG